MIVVVEVHMLRSLGSRSSTSFICSLDYRLQVVLLYTTSSSFALEVKILHKCSYFVSYFMFTEIINLHAHCLHNLRDFVICSIQKSRAQQLQIT